MIRLETPQSQGLYDARNEHDACGVGFVVDVKGRKSSLVIKQALEVLLSLEHRGACGCETNTGDGAGILFQTPHVFLLNECAQVGIELPEFGQYGVGMVFLPQDQAARQQCQLEFENIISDEGQTLLGWRTVPTNNESIGPTAKASQPVVRQIFIQRSDDLPDLAAFERKLYVIRRRIARAVKRSDIHQRSMFYVSSLSYKTIVYKGMLTPGQLSSFYPDLTSPLLSSALAMIHSRFSTNTFPSWARAHPYRYLAHNGEINTLRGNINWMRARESKFQSQLFGHDLQKILPLIDTEASDSGMFDNVLEMLTLAGRTLPHVMMLMIPAPWTGDTFMDDKVRAFYEYHSFLMEPWDGPAAVTFTDGVKVGAVLDRNGLRPARYYITKDDLVVMSSEVGVLDLPPDQIVFKGRLQPGRMFLVDTEQGGIIDDEELKRSLADEHPYQEWLDANTLRLEQLPEPPYVNQSNPEKLRLRQRVFCYTREELRLIIEPMAAEGSEPVGSMGTDTPLAVLSKRPQLLYNYFKQLFAQVTNPPIDGIREELIMSSDTCVGPEANMLEPTPECARQIKLSSPILANSELEKLRLLGESSGPWGANGFKTITIPILFRASLGGRELVRALEGVFHQADAVIAAGYETIILSDRDLDSEMAPIPALLAVSGLHHHLIRKGTRTQVGLIVESGEPREVHHFALLLSYGAAAINPYLVFETLTKNGGTDASIHNYVKAVNKGIVKVISKMGISTTQGYCGAQVFEALGLSEEFIDYYFTWTPSRIGGIGIDVIAEETRLRHESAFDESSTRHQLLDKGGEYQYRAGGEVHLFNPETIHTLQNACRTADYVKFKHYSSLVNDHTRNLCTLRGLLELKTGGPSIPIEEVEPVKAILARFKTGAMSYGSISQESHEALAVAMNRIGGRSNTGEGGEDPERFYTEPNGDSRNSKIKQVASARFGVTSHYLVSADEIQIKISQGAKPGEGGQLPGHKVYPWIAKVRHSTPGVGLISPPPHHDIYSIEDLAQLIFDLKNANPQARISVKLVAESGVGTIAAGVAKARADVILISGYDGGTGASPLTSIKHAGVPWELGLAETHQTLLLNDLRSRVRLETDGQLRTGRDVVIAAMLGAEEFGFATAPLVAMGCIMMRACHLNTCPVGIATQDPNLRARFAGDPSHVVNFMKFVAQEVRELMAQLGFRRLHELVGRCDLLQMGDIDHWKARGLDFSQILFRPELPEQVGRYQEVVQEHALEDTLDQKVLLGLCRPALAEGKPVSATLPIRNTDRAVGTRLGCELTRQYGPAGLPDDSVRLHFKGSAGQSFGAFVPKGITLTLEGDANDYVGKGLSGGRIIVFPPKVSIFHADENVILGNVAFYGATRGYAYINGVAGERFCVRNSGANVVVEAVGDHGCEYMTGGRVVVLGKTGRNFAAGMSGGIAYVADDEDRFDACCNLEMVSLTRLEESAESDLVKDMIFRHAEFTGSRRAAQLLLDWEQSLKKIVRVMPKDLQQVLESQQREMIAVGQDDHD